jgi:Taurine catabolism dioxygenase TauD, TfdA family
MTVTSAKLGDNLAPVGGPSAWSPVTLPTASWRLDVDAEVADELKRTAARAAFAVRGRSLADRTPRGPAGPELRVLAAEVTRRLFLGCGFVLLAGLPAGSEEESARLFWALGTQIGRLLPQNDRGDLLDWVRDEHVATVRGAKTNRALVYHTDFAGVIPDIFGLLTVRTARSGGASLLVSGHKVHDDLLRESPGHLDRLYREFWFDRSNDAGVGEPPAFRAPIFSRSGSRVAMVYNRVRIHRGHRMRDDPLGRKDIEALDRLDAATADKANNLVLTLGPGDALLANNAVILHNRTAFVDPEEPGRGRLLLRIWLSRGD